MLFPEASSVTTENPVNGYGVIGFLKLPIEKVVEAVMEEEAE